MKRRTFLSRSALAGAALTAPRALAQGGDSELRVAVIGLRGRGRSHLDGVTKSKGARVVAVCDVDPEVLEKTVRDLDGKGLKVRRFEDYRKVCEDGDIDAVTIATPNHTHALIGATAAANGKHVYVEKPVSHNVWEGRELAEAQRRHGVVIQHGFQRRSESAWAEAFDWIAQGEIGKLRIARGFCYKPRKSIGKVKGPRTAPQGLNYDLWCGPREMLPINREQFHYDWHWQFPWGNGDLGNQGPHQLDVCRWALGDPAGLPRSVFSCGDRFAHDDDGDWANTQVVHLDYEQAPILFEVRGLPRKDLDYGSGMDAYRGQSIGNVIEYEGGSLVGGHGNRCSVVDADGKTIREFSGGGSHFQTWIDSVHGKTQEPGRAAESGHLSSALAHIGNISWQLAPKGAKLPEFDDESLADAVARMQDHLRANGIDPAKHPLRIGPRLELEPGEESFAGEWAGDANPLLRGSYREEFELPT